MIPRTLVKHEMNARSVSMGFYCWYALAKFVVNLAQSSSQDWIVPGVRFMSQVRAGPVKAT